MATTAKRIYTREELMSVGEEPYGVVHSVCDLCGGQSWEHIETLFPDDHEDDCVLANPDVFGVTVSAMTRAREDICGDCPASERANCVVTDWLLECHETLLAKCCRYAVEDERLC